MKFKFLKINAVNIIFIAIISSVLIVVFVNRMNNSFNENNIENLENISLLTSFENWHVNHGDAQLNRYVDLNEINISNVNNLELMWQLDLENHDFQVQSSAVVFNELIISHTADNKLIAIDVSSGNIIWTFYSKFSSLNSRGLIIFEEKIYTMEGNYLICINPKDGKACDNFGIDGYVTLEHKSKINPIIYKNSILVLTMNPTIVKIDLKDGSILWEKNLGEDNLSFSPWGAASIDYSRGVIYTTTGNPKPTFDGSARPGNNLYANSLLAISADSGEVIWHFQETRHDIWNLDIAAGPILSTIYNGKNYIDVVIGLTKIGNILVFDRSSGKSIYPIGEFQTVTSKRGTESISKYQPSIQFPEPFSKQEFTLNDITNLSTEKYNYVKEIVKSSNIGRLIPHEPNAPSVYFGVHGGAQWPGGALNPNTNILFFASSHIPWILEFEEENGSLNLKEWKQLLDDEGYPGSKPPWGTLNAYNMNNGEKLWTVPFGEYSNLSMQGFPITGTENFSGPTVTSGELLFVSGARDKYLYAINTNNGETLWKYKLPFTGAAAPTVFEYMNKQYVFVQSTGGGKLKQFDKFNEIKEGNSYFLFSLP